MQPLKVINHKKMAYTRLTAAAAAAMIKDQDNIGLSGFTPNGVPRQHSANSPKEPSQNMKQDAPSK